MTQPKKPTGQTADAPPSPFVHTPPDSPGHECKSAPEGDPMVMNMFPSSATLDDAPNSDGMALSNGSAPPTPLSTPIGEFPQKGQMLGEGPQQPVTLAGLKDLLMEVVQELKAGPAAVQSEATTPKPERKPTVAPLGSKLEFKRIEQVWDKATRTYVDKATVKEELDELDQYAFVVRSRGAITGGNSIRRLVYVDIKSKHLRSVLQDTMKNVKTVSLQEKKPSVELDLLYHFLPELKAHESKLAGAPERQDELRYLSLLVEFISTTYQPITERLATQLECGKVTWDILWTIFKPGSIIYTKCFGTEKQRCVVLNAIEQKRKPGGVDYYNLDCSYVDCDRDVLGKAGILLEIDRFRGPRRIDLLPAFPLQYHPEEEAVRRNLTECGRKFCGLVGTHIRHCRGTAFFMERGVPVRVKVDGRVGIDATFFREMNPNYLRPRVEKYNSMGLDADGICYVDLDALLDQQAQIERERVKSDGAAAFDMNDDDYLTCCPTIPGFSFKDNAFYEFAVEDICDIKWSRSLFKSLTIPDEQRAVLMALARTRMGVVPAIPFDDFVAGKGRGLSVLLYGPPGVGKTLTAEATAEHLERPLYPIPAAQLVTRPDFLEDNLKHTFKIAEHFDALLLLDEADVFLERRSSFNSSKDGVIKNLMSVAHALATVDGARVDQPDEIIWDKVYEAVTESTPPPRPLHSFQTPLTRNTGSSVNSSELRTDMDPVLREELGPLYIDIPNFHETSFEDIPRLQTNAQASGWPEGVKEAPVLAWLSETIDKIRQFFEEHAPDETVRRRPLAQPHKPLKGSTAKRTLDIGFMDGTDPLEDGKYAWSQILVPGELKNKPGYETQSRLDTGRYAREVLAAQDSRLFVPGFTLCGSLMRLWHFDRLGGIASEQFDIHEEGLRFVSVMLGYMLMTEGRLGFDPTIITNADGSRYFKIERNGKEERLIIDGVINRAHCVAGRATTCWKVHRDGDESRTPLVIKGSWQYPERDEEGELLREATEKGVVNVARYFYHATVQVEGRDCDIHDVVRRRWDITTASNYKPAGSRPPLSRSASHKGKSSRTASRKRSSTCVEPSLPPGKRSQSQHPSHPNRVYRLVGVEDYGQPIYTASSRVALLAALEECIEGYESLHQKAGMLQRDISPNNLMINEDKESASWKAFIIDLDLAIKEDREGASGARGKTGTRAFMAIGVLLNEQHSFMHDLESFFWVLFWICIHYEGPDKGKVVEGFEDWNYMSTEKLAGVKKGAIDDEGDFLKSTAEHFTEYYQPLVPWVNRLRRVVFPNGRRWKTPDTSLYSAMREILRNAQEDPNVIGLN
ncbi:uncharacterized protein GIQ15_04300 [Arthroderma uncinatum]|uniref:uncharacterized protein n=1 Tax=Arthroderma uncinatum TaxID=74035 RepID=UPI00144AF80F|nr:uncharacterized protein GIQ15_04300 [Arthroderma uncinatum]KAF3481541.1 hypothetical protein GIQ15_04300 [Arthroderma uncinatum]